MKDLVEQMKRFADENPFHPGVDDIFKFVRPIIIGSCKLKITLTRTIVGRHQFYQFSMGHESGNPAAIPTEVVQKLKQAFMPNGFSLPSALGNTYQWIQECKQ